MGAWRVGVAIKPEQEFGVEDDGASWHYVGIGMDMNFTAKNGWKYQNGMGSKTPQLQFEGRFSGTWGGNLYFDYNNFYWLLFGLEDYCFKAESYATADSPDEDRAIGAHMFSVSNKKSLKSFSMRILKLDREVGGPFDENIVYLGCTMNNVSPAYEGASTSAVKCGINGAFVDMKLTAENLTDTVKSSDGVISSRKKIVPINWGCLQVLNADGDKWEKIANIERTGYKFTRTITSIPDCGERIDTAYYESNVSPITITAQVYSRNANQWQTRMHTGGIRNDINTSSPTNVSEPRRKGLEPIPNIRIASGSRIKNEGEIPDYLCYAEFEDAGVDSWGNTYNPGSEITESPTIQAMKGRIIIKTPDVTSALTDLPRGASAGTIVTVTYDFDNGDSVPDLKLQFPQNDTITLIDYKGTKSGYKFAGWLIGTASTATPSGSQYTLSNTDVTMTAKWESTS